MIIAAGDSFIWGSELKDSPHGGPDGYSRSTFTALLAKDYEYKCIAYPGIGNREISRRVMEVCRHTPARLVVVCWTWPTRDDTLTGDREILNLQQYFEYHNIPYMFTCADNCVFTPGNTKINWEQWFLFPPAKEEWNTSSPRGFYQWAVENNYECGKDRHPLEQAHIDAAKLMQDKFNRLIQ